MLLKIRDSQLTCKIAKKDLTPREQVEMVEEQRCFPLFPCCSVNFQLSVKEKHDRKIIIPLIEDHEIRYLI